MPKKVYVSADTADLANFNYKGVYVSLTIDSRKWKVTERDAAGKPSAHDKTQKLPIVLRVTKDSKRLYLAVGEKFTMDEWLLICEHEQSTRVRSDSQLREDLKKHLERIKPMVLEMVDNGSFTFESLKDRYNGVVDESVSIYSVWEEYLQAKVEEGKAGTARCSKDIRNRFIKDMGEKVTFPEINKDFIEKWVKVMKRSGLSITSVAIALRMFRTIVNICITRGLIHGNTKEMFQGTGYNKSQSRKHEFLDVATMRQLYDFWEKEEVKDENGKELFFPKEKNAVFRDLGLFLFMYLGDGQNLADTLRLTYDGWYSSSKGKQMRFLRHKTRERNESASEVIFPITPEIQKIIDRYGNKPKKGARVFPIMKTDITPEQEVWVIQRYNRSIREHMAKIVDLLGMEQVPSPTWARHSFATNLNNSGMVPYKYISDSMGHSSSGDITANYIGAYPPETMLEYNWYLLHDKSEKIQQPVVGKQALLEMLKNMSEEERKDLLSSL